MGTYTSSGDAPAELRNAKRGGLREELVEFAGHTTSLAYIAATSLVFGCLYTFIANAQQIFGELYGLGDGFVFAFAFVALAMSVSSLTNARIVVRFGLPWLAAIFFLFSLIAPNFNAIVLEPMGNIAGLATSMFGFFTSLFAAWLGWIIGGAYDGSLFPFSFGFFILSSGALLIIWIIEGRCGVFR